MKILYKDYFSLVQECASNELSPPKLLEKIRFLDKSKTSDCNIAKAADMVSAVIHRDLKKLIRTANMKLITLTRVFGIPYKTVQNWAEGLRELPLYWLALIGYVLISELSELSEDDQDQHITAKQS